MQRRCAVSGHTFEIHKEDNDFYQNIGVPVPTLCPNERMRRKMIWRNERRLYRRACTLCQKKIVSLYHPDSPQPTYCQNCWWGNGWDGLTSGREIDFSRPFFDQLNAILKATPLLSTLVYKSDNCEYNNDVGSSKNSYMCTRSHNCENALYSHRAYSSSSCLDCHTITDCQLTSYCIYCTKCYNCHFLKDCNTCTDCFFSYDLTGCSNCFLCYNLRQKDYCILNEQYTKDDYHRRIQEINFASFSVFQSLKRNYRVLMKTHAIHPEIRQTNCEECVGDNLLNCKDMYSAFGGLGSQNVRYAWEPRNLKDAMDLYTCGNSELLYECTSVSGESYNVKFSSKVKGSSDINYCIECFFSKNLFGCVGLKRAQYCIFNRQYTKEQYEVLVEKLMAHMRATGEWGEFFPMTMSPHAYNETVAQEYFPLTKEEALSQGLQWRDSFDQPFVSHGVITAKTLPDCINDIPDDILNWAIACETTQRLFKIIKQELAYYREQRLPVPRFHYDERHRQRVSACNPYVLWQRNCAKCQQSMSTSFAPERPEIVYCEECYRKKVY